MSSIEKLFNKLHERVETKGDKFEIFVKLFLETDPTFKKIFKKIYFYEKWEYKWGPVDLGTDLIGETHDNKIWAIQAKCHKPEYSIKKEDIDSFLSDSNRKNVNNRLLIATTNKISNNGYQTIHGQEKPVRLFLLKDFKNINSLNFDYFSKTKKDKIKIKEPRPYQRKILKLINQGFKKNNKGKVFLPCGTGKTLIALWTNENIKSNLTIVFVPSISLISQTVTEWSQNSTQQFNFICICSDKTVVNKDELNESVIDTFLPSTTNKEDIKNFLKIKGKKVIFCTYQSSLVLSKALKDNYIDLIICDEAHRCAGMHDSFYTIPLKDKYFKSKFKIFFTATKKIYSDKIKKSFKANNLISYDMESEVFGNLFYEMKFSEAIKMKLLSDYDVVILGFKDPKNLKLFSERKLVKLDKKNKTDVGTLTAHLSIIKSIKKYSLRKVITFHSKVENAKSFALDFPKICSWLPEKDLLDIRIWSKHINGMQKSHVREDLLQILGGRKMNEFSMITNARCLSEGIDVPSVNGIVYVEPKQSHIDIIQSVGRAIRKNNNNKKSKIIIPINISNSNDPDIEFQNTSYEKVWNVLKALKSHDDDLKEEIDDFRSNLGQKKTNIKFKKIIFDLPEEINKSFVDSFKVKLIKQTSDNFYEFVTEVKNYEKKNGDCCVPQKYMSNNIKVGKLVAYYRGKGSKKRLSAEKYSTLDNINGWVWNEIDARWYNFFNLAKDYLNKNNLDNVKQDVVYKGYNIGSWISKQRDLYNKIKDGKTNYERNGKKAIVDVDSFTKKLSSFNSIPNWKWSFPNKWEMHFNAVKEYLTTKKIETLTTKVVFKGLKIGDWVRMQRESIYKFENNLKFVPGRVLNKERVNQLAKIEINSKTLQDLIWEKNIQILTEYIEKYGWNGVLKGNMEKTKNNIYKGLNIYNFIMREKLSYNPKSIKFRERRSAERKKILINLKFPFIKND